MLPNYKWETEGFEISLPEIQQVNYGHLLLALIITALHYGATMCMHYYIYIMQIWTIDMILLQNILK